MKIDKKLKGKTIVEAEVTGYDITLKFNDGSVFEYNASDGGYSVWEYRKSEE